MNLFNLKCFKAHNGALLVLLSIFGCYVSCNNSNNEKVDINSNIPVYNFNEIEPILYTKTNKTYLINFWAMWCAPCVKELPYIEEFAAQNPDVEVILVSLDFPKEIETKLKPFLKEHKIKSKVVILDDPDSNSWIDKIDPNWSGAIPFTIIFNKNQRLFYERSFESLDDLKKQITKLN